MAENVPLTAQNISPSAAPEETDPPVPVTDAATGHIAVLINIPILRKMPTMITDSRL